MRILSAIVNLSELSIDPANVRKTGRGKEPKFAASIRVRGVLEPLIVRSDPKGDRMGQRHLPALWSSQSDGLARSWTSCLHIYIVYTP